MYFINGSESVSNMCRVNREGSTVRNIWIRAYNWTTNVGKAAAAIDHEGVKESITKYCRRYACDGNADRRIYQPGEPGTERPEDSVGALERSHLFIDT